MYFWDFSKHEYSPESSWSKHLIIWSSSMMSQNTILMMYTLVYSKGCFFSNSIGMFSLVHQVGKQGPPLAGSFPGASSINSRLPHHGPSHTLPWWYSFLLWLTWIGTNCFKQGMLGPELGNIVWKPRSRLQPCRFLPQYPDDIQRASWLWWRLWVGPTDRGMDCNNTSLVANVCLFYS